MAKYLITPSAAADGKLHITGSLARHLGQVLRVRTGEILHFTDGEATEYEAAVESTAKDTVTLDIINAGPVTGELPFDIWLLQGIAKGEKMDFIVQKTVELGVSHILPLETEHTVVKLKGKGEEKARRWQKIAAAAAEQSGRGRLPVVHTPRTLPEALADTAALGRLVFLWEKEKQGQLRQALASFRGEPLRLLIGPEGGFSDTEADLALAGGGFPVTLGPRILRTETASIAVLGAIGYALGDWGRAT